MSERDESEKSAQPLIAVSVTDLFGLGKAGGLIAPQVERLLQALEKGASRIYGGFLEPHLIGAARRNELRANLKAFSALKKAWDDDPGVIEHMRERLFSTEIRREFNIQAAAAEAIAHAHESKIDAESFEVDEDFIVEWIDGVKDVGNEAVRKIWARLLAAAPSRPDGRVPKAVVDLAKNFDSGTAKAFELAACLHRVFGAIPTNTELFTGLSFNGRLELLADIGALEIQNSPTIKIRPLELQFRTTEGRQGYTIYSMRYRAKILADIVVNADDSRATDLLGSLINDPDRWGKILVSGLPKSRALVSHIGDDRPAFLAGTPGTLDDGDAGYHESRLKSFSGEGARLVRAWHTAGWLGQKKKKSPLP